MINRMPDDYRFHHVMKHVFESIIAENTANDEPTAPRIQIIGRKGGAVTPPWEFYYTNKIMRGAGVPKSDMSKLKGCGCIGPCDPKSKTCTCIKRQKKWADDSSVKGFLYNKKEKLTTDKGYPIFECNDACECSEDCMNRVIGRGRKAEISIQLTDKKGWGVFADKPIQKGTFLGVYAGEMILEAEADDRGKLYDKYGRTYLFDMDFWFLRGLAREQEKDTNQVSSTHTIDAFHVGNVRIHTISDRASTEPLPFFLLSMQFTRFLNHSCEPNCQIVASYVNEPDMHKPTLTIFTYKDVQAGEELTFAYHGLGLDEDDPEEEVEESGEMKKIVVRIHITLRQNEDC
ncbi:hypothetical protein M422DRAFT_49976 [Sphaerobolus stellatus SS14]|uniref:Histone-lysine N-methyltransferase n=1 Tax=Sphaerobolus stellatus (strain SS14) TaxID=990650 RepID=A0A0C9U647_SPHS4|nr:hypothetical protein M422DRAFT_49976 [Sphaerobolus stellatus SS14]